MAHKIPTCGKFWILYLILFITALSSEAQINSNCQDNTSDQSYSATASFNYGSASGMYNSELTSAIIVGQTSVQNKMFSPSFKSDLGFWSQFLLPPLAPYVQASEGNLGDRVEITWSVSALSPVTTDVFKVYRNGTFLDEVENDERVYVDYNVVAGEFYTYTVRGVNQAGIGQSGSAVGFLNPNGVITGQVNTINGNPVSECSIDLSPTLGSSLRFKGDGVCIADYSPLYDTSKFSVTLWVRQDSLNDFRGLVDLGSASAKNWYIHTTDLADGRGISAGINSGFEAIDYIFPDSTALDWHHVAVTFNGNTLLLYVDGELSGSVQGTMIRDTLPLTIGGITESSGYYQGLLDEVAIFNRQLTQTEIRRQMNKSISSRVEGLVSYWKMDEDTGTTTYDLTDNQNRLYMCGPSWSGINSPITNSSLTDENGYYILEGINYGSGETFTVRPSKNIYDDVSIEFNAANQDIATLTNFVIPDTSAISLTFNPFSLEGTQIILSKGDDFSLKLVGGNLIVEIEGHESNLGPITLGWHQAVINLIQDGGNINTELFLDGVSQLVNSRAGELSSWSMDSQVWTLGAQANSTNDFYTGLVQEFLVYNDNLTLSEIETNNNVGTDTGHPSIYSFFPLNESRGDSLYNLSETGGAGFMANASWANDAKNLNFTAHEFSPSTRLVTLNSTNTSTDQVDFTDLSTIAISGYVRYEGTTCFADSVEILVNGESTIPATYTNTSGYFIIDLEPGSTVKISPKYDNHTFSPAFFEAKKIASPISGVLFKNTTKRSVQGQLTGGHCYKSIFEAGEEATVFLKSIGSTCINNTYIIQADPSGKFEFEDMPPLRYTIGVEDHDNPDIKEFFKDSGREIDLDKKNDTIDFIYYSGPNISFNGFDVAGDCGFKTLNQNTQYSIPISIFQNYAGGNCPIDTGTVVIFNSFTQDAQILDTIEVSGSFNYNFFAGPPNIAAPFTKTSTFKVTADNKSISETLEAVIVGSRTRGNNFVSTSPSIPFMILHDPPGDGSYSYWNKGTSHCVNMIGGETFVDGDIVDNQVLLAPDINLSIGGGIISTTVTTDATLDLDFQTSFRTDSTITNKLETCTESLVEYTTDQNEYLPGETSDLFLGGSFNMLYGIRDILSIEDCQIVLDTGLNIIPESFASTFSYTEYEINNFVIPNLIGIGDQESADQWQRIIDNNNLNKQEATLDENISFGSGAIIEKSFTSRSTKIDEFVVTTQLDTTDAIALGLNVNGVGYLGTMTTIMGWGESDIDITTNDTIQTFGYRLGDNDPGDLFTVNVKTDPVHSSPLFETVSGQSSCPYEMNTVNREEVTMEVDKQVALDIGENEEATFQFNLGNISQTAEAMQYVFSLRSSSNVNGAEVKIAGLDPLDVEYFIPPFESIPVTVTVARSPNAFTDTLTFDLYSLCENERRVALGLPREEGLFHTSETIIVDFIEPCSFVDINDPMQDWVLTPEDGDSLPIRLVDYDIMDPDLEKISVQYRRTQGNGVWIQILEVPKDSLGTTFERVYWNTAGQADGLYEIRAQALCFGNQETGTSHVIRGKIERTPPDLFGTAEPADGVLSRGDEISITFTEPIQCSEIILASGIGSNIDNGNLGLYDTQTGALIDFTLSCSEDKLVLVPNVSNSFLENKVLRVELDSIQDLAGNQSASLEWEFVVDQNSLNWIDREDVKVIKFEEDFVSIERRIENRGGFNITWTLDNLPDWCTIYPTSGDLAPGDVRIITFEFDQSMAFGSQLQTILLSGPEGDEPMVVSARVVCPAPDYEIVPGDWEYAMNFTAELDIEGEISIDEEDILAAFVDEELRGVGKVQYYPSIDKHLVFLTVYANTLDPSTVNMRIWDASSCLLFSPVVESFIFQSDDLIGTPLTPQIIHTSSNILKEVEVNPGWNWLSFNLELTESSPDSVLQTIDNPTDGILKSQTEFAQFADGFGWFGSLDSIGNTSSYQLRISDHDTILVRGQLIDESTVEIPLAEGWNWIGYLPRSPLPINTALADISVLDGDVIKSQTTFAQYVSGFGWIGTLSSMRPNEGYIIKTSLEDTLIYPTVSVGFKEDLYDIEKRSTLPNGWELNPFDFEHSMTMTGSIVEDGFNITQDGWYLGAFHNEECRGIAEALWVAPLDDYLFFITMYSNATGEKLDFKLYNGTESSELLETEYFSIDTQIGEIENPFEFGILTTNTKDHDISSLINISPNPIQKGEKLLIQSEAIFKSDVKARIYNVDGRLISEHKYKVENGKLNIRLSTENLSLGVHHIILNDDTLTVNKKFIIVK